MAADSRVSHVTQRETYPEIMGLEMAAEYTGHGQEHFKELVRSDTVPHVHVGSKGRNYVFYRTSLDLWKLFSSTENMAPGAVRDLMLQAAIAAGAAPTTGR